MAVTTWLLLSLLIVHAVTCQDTCGVPAIEPSVNERVLGGMEAVPHSWPWMVSLQADGSHFCGGSLINNQWVVSAAHCDFIFKSSWDESFVVVGLHRQSQSDHFTVRVPVSKVIINQKFNRTGQLLTSDIMLLKLAYPVEFNTAVYPVCLPTQFQVLPTGKRCYATGWGLLQIGGDLPDELQQVMLPIIDREVCNQPTWYNNTIDDSMVCAGYEEGQLGNCMGDSGGPLVYYDGARWTLYGIVSWGREPCAVANKPGIYNRVSAYIEWINKTIRENSE